MNCRKDDIAYVTGLAFPVSDLNSRFVQVKEMVLGDCTVYWKLDRTLRFRAKADFSHHGVAYREGETLEVDTIEDAFLRPIRHPGDDAVDEMVRFFPVPKPETA